MKVTSAYGKKLSLFRPCQRGNFSFHAPEEGEYMACFFASDHKPATTMTVDFERKSGVVSKDWTNVAKKGSIEVDLDSSRQLTQSSESEEVKEHHYAGTSKSTRGTELNDNANHAILVGTL